MEKVCYALWRDPATDADAIRTWATDKLVPGLSDIAEIHGGQVLAEADEGASVRVGSAADGTLLTGLVAVWLDIYQDREAIDACVDAGPLARWASYLVSESVPYDDRTVVRTPGKPAPGMTMTTLFDKKAGVSEDEFYRVWHEMHRLTTVELHPVYVYQRNEVVRALSPGARPLRGIVYEPTRTIDAMLDPHTFYGSGGDDATLKANVDRVVTETGAFIDYTTIEVAAMHWYELPGSATD